MTLLKENLYIGERPAEHDLVWATGDPRTEDGLDPDQLNERFSLGFDDPRNLVLRNELINKKILTIHRDTGNLKINTPIDIGEKIIDEIHLAGDETRISGFSDGTHLIRYSSTDSDKIMRIVREGVSDYDLEVYKDGSPARVHTEEDDTIDAAFLDGTPADAHAVLSADELVTGEWTFEAGTTLERALFGSDATISADGASTLVFGTPTTPAVEINTYSGAIHAGDEITIDGENVLTSANGYVDVEDDGVLVEESVDTLNFGDDLAVTSDGVKANIVWDGADVPNEIYQDGTLAVADADGLDFLNDFGVAEGDSGAAEITLDTDAYADIDADIDITGEWTINIDEGGQFETPMSFVEASVSATQYPFGLSTMGIGRDTDYPGQNIASMTIRHAANRTLQFGGGKADRFWFRRYHEDDGWGEFNELWTDQNQGEGSGLDADLLDGRDSDVYAELDVDEEITGRWAYDTGIELNHGDQYGLKFDHDGNDNRMVYGGWPQSNRWALMPHDGGTWDPSKLMYDFNRQLWEFDDRPKVAGSDVVLMDDPVIDQNDDVYQRASISVGFSGISIELVSMVTSDENRDLFVKDFEPDFDDWTDGDIWCHEGVGIYVNVAGTLKVIATVD